MFYIRSHRDRCSRERHRLFRRRRRQHQFQSRPCPRALQSRLAPLQNAFYSTREESDHGGSDPGTPDSDLDDAYYALCCAYCDELLPPSPSEELCFLQSALDAKSSMDGRNGLDASSNPFHRHICPIVTTLNYCIQHRFESKEVAILNNAVWSSVIPVDFRSLKARVQSLLPRLHTVVENPHDNEFYEDLKTAIQKTGSARALGIHGEHASLERTSAG